MTYACLALLQQVHEPRGHQVQRRRRRRRAMHVPDQLGQSELPFDVRLGLGARAHDSGAFVVWGGGGCGKG